MHTNTQPLVSIVIPCYNHEKYVQDCIDSVIKQDYENIELIIIDDGSHDGSVNKIEEMIDLCQKRFVRFEFRSRPNKGLCATLNEALKWCEGQYFSPLASDDIALPNKISFLVSKIINSNIDAVFGQTMSFSNHDSIYDSELTEKIEEYEYLFEDIFLLTKIPEAPAALIKTSSIYEVSGYPEDIILEDFYLWLVFLKNSKRLVSYNKVVTLYRKHPNNTVNDHERMYLGRLQILNLFKDDKLYKKSYNNNLIMLARALASTETIKPIIKIIRSRTYNKEVAFIIIKSITPKRLLKKIKSFKKL